MSATDPTRPRIGIDASSVVGRRTGIGQATAQLLAALAECWPEGWPAARVLINSRVHELPAGDAWVASGRFEVVRRRIPGRLLMRAWQYAGWPPIERLLGPLDLIHAPASYIPPVRAARRIVTVHDLYFQHAPGEVEAFGGLYFARTFERGLARVDHVIAVSSFTREELLKFYALDPARVSVVPQAVDGSRFRVDPQPRDGSYLDLLGIRPPYVLCVATIEPRKNLVRLIEAYARVGQILRAAHQKLPPLVIAGQLGWGAKALEARLAEARMRETVKLTGYLPDDALPALYRQALGLVMPSLYEGFGMPVLEAMACGCPTAVARAGSLPEVAGQATHYFNPRASDAMARALVEFIANPHLRADLRDAGLRRAREFTWAATARATLEAYRRALGIAPAGGGVAEEADEAETVGEKATA